MERITSPIRLLPSPPLPMSISIFWPLVHRLLVNNYRFTISDRARENISVVVREANNL